MASSGTIWIPVAPSFRGFGAAMIKEATGASRAAADRLDSDLSRAGQSAGAKAGKGIADGVKASAAQVEKATNQVVQARKRESDAAANVTLAEAKLADSRAKGASADRIATQEAALVSARRKQESAAGQLAGAEGDLEAVRKGEPGRAQALIRSSSQVENARTRAADASDKVRLAEEKLDRVQKDTSSTATQVATAQAQLTRAKSNSASATDVLRGKEQLHEATLEEVEQQANQTGDAVEDAGKKAGRSGGLMSKAAKGAQNLALGLGAAAATGIGVALTKGFSRINQIDQATAKLSGLGHEAQAVETIMESATAAVTGTAFGLGDAATVAAATVAAGIKPGQDLERTLRLVGDAATIAGVDMSTMGSIVNKVATSDMMQMDVANQLMDAGIPILQMVGDQMGVTAGEARDLASEGKVSFETFQNALEEGLGGAALKSGETLQGSLDNLGAAMGRLGEAALKPFMQDGKDLIGMFTEWVNTLTEQVGPAIEGMADWLVNSLIPAIKDMVNWVRDNKDLLTTLTVAVVSGVAAFKIYQTTLIAITAVKKAYAAATLFASKGVKGLNAAMKANVIGIVIAAVVALVAGLIWFFTQTETGQRIWASFTEALKSGWETVKAAFATAWGVIQPVLSGIWEAVKIVGGVFAAVVLGVIMVVWNLMSAYLSFVWESVIKPVFSGIQWALQALGTFFGWVWTSLIQPAWNALGMGIAWVWNSVIRPAWDALKIALGAVGTFFQWVWSAVISPAWNALGAGIAFVWNTVIRPAWDALKTALGVVGSFFQRIWNSVIKPVWDALGAGIKAVIDSVIKPAWDGLKSALGSVGDFFSTIVEGIRNTWDKMKGHVARPINFVIDTVWNDGLVKAWNTIQDFLPGLPRANPLRPVAFAEGGPVPMMPGAKRGKDSVHALMMPNEHVWDVQDVNRSGGHQAQYQMRGMVERGVPFTWVDGRVVPAGHGLEPRRFEDGGAVSGARLSPSPGEGGLQPIAILAKRLIHRIWPEIATIGGYRQDAYPEHPSGRALDVMVGVGNPVGDEVTSWALANDSVLPLIHALWKQTVWMPNGSTQSMGERGSPTQNHMDHPHLWYQPKNVDPNVVPGGLVGHDGLTREDRLGVIKEKISEILDKALDPIREGIDSVVGTPPPEMLGIPTQALDNTKEAAVDRTFEFVEGLADDLKEVYNKARDVVSGVTGFFTGGINRDTGGILPQGQSLVNNETGKPEQILNWEQIQQVIRLAESAQGAAALQAWALGDPHQALRMGVEQGTVDAIEKMGTDLATEIHALGEVGRDSFIKSARNDALDFFGFKGLADGIDSIWEAFNKPPQAAATSGGTRSAISTSGPTSTGGGVTTHGDPNATYQTKEVELETQMPDFDRANPPGAGAERWRSMMVDALKNQGMDDWANNPEIVDRFVRQIDTESGGDPNIAQQIVDVNGTGEAAGVGLGQAIPGTWAAYRDPELPDDRRNGWAMLNFMARYVRQKYGPQGYNSIGNGIGYDRGGIANGIGLMPKYTLRPERVLDPNQTQAFEDWLAAGTSDGTLEVLSGLPSAQEFESVLARVTEESEGRAGGGGPMVYIEKLEARDEGEAMAAAHREARRMARSSGLAGGRW